MVLFNTFFSYDECRAGFISFCFCINFIMALLTSSKDQLSNLNSSTLLKEMLEKEMATDSSILTWEIPDRETWRVTVCGVAKSLTRLGN